MNRRIVIFATLLLIASTAVLIPQEPQQAPATQPAVVPVGNLFLQDASLMQVIDQLARQLQINYVVDVDTDINAGVTLNTYGQPGDLDAWNLLEILLRINGLGMVQEGDLYRIVETNRLARQPISQISDPNQIPEDDRNMLNLVFLKYVTVDELTKVLTEFTDDRTIIRTYAPANLLILLDSRRNMRRLMDLIALFDSDTFAGERVRLYEIENTLPSELVDELEDVLKSLSLDNQTSTVRFLPVDRISTLIAVAPNPGVFQTVEEWIDRLDVPITETSGVIDTYVYRVRYGRADCLALALNQLYYPNYASGFGGGTGFGGGAGYPAAGGYGAGYPGNYAAGGYGYGGGGFGGGTGFGGGIGQNSFNNNFGGSGGCGPFSGLGNSFGGGVGGGFGGVAGFGGYAAQVPLTATAGGLVGATDTQATAGVAPAGDANGPVPPRIVANPLDNSLLIQGNAQQYQAILRLLRELDRPPRQILLEAKIYSVAMSGSFSSGVSAWFQAISGNDRRPTASLLGGASTLNAGWLVSQSRELMAALQLQEQNSNVRVISEPSLIATDSIPATINVGAQVPVLAGQVVTPGQIGTPSVTQGISSRNTGVTLQVNARVNPSGVVTLIINQEVSRPADSSGGTSSGSSQNLTPTFDQQVVQTQITLQDGDTIAIGGTISEETTNTSTGIPGLHRIPVLGFLFGNKSFTTARSELIMFMTPHVIYDTIDLVEASEELKSRMRRLRRYITE